ncbi:lytic polysaccharide monooxygenase, partial [Patellaria atrata CBS 101060]
LLALTASILDKAAAHGFVRGVKVNGQWTAGSDPVWYYHPANSKPVTAGWDSLNQDLGFISPSAFQSNDINCHKSATAGKAYVDAKAGDNIEFYWNTWPDSHKGPIINYIAPCNGECTSQSPGNLRWTKISQSGFISGNTWVTDELIKKNFTSSTILPRNLKAGNYVIRHEIIALHGGVNDDGAQAYPQCLNLRVAGSGSASPSGGVAGTSLYKRTDAGIRFNLYTSFSSYPYPGPAVWTGGN